MDKEISEKKYYCFDVSETFVHHIGVWAESEEDAEKKLYSVIEDKDRELITKEGSRMDAYTKIHPWGWCGYSVRWTTLNPEDDPDIN